MEILDSGNDRNRICSLPIQVSIRVCRNSLKLKDLLQWAPGTILSFDQPATSPLVLLVNQQEMGDGQTVEVGSSVGLRIAQIKRLR